MKGSDHFHSRKTQIKNVISKGSRGQLQGLKGTRSGFFMSLLFQNSVSKLSCSYKALSVGTDKGPRHWSSVCTVSQCSLPDPPGPGPRQAGSTMAAALVMAPYQRDSYSF